MVLVVVFEGSIAPDGRDMRQSGLQMLHHHRQITAVAFAVNRVAFRNANHRGIQHPRVLDQAGGAQLGHRQLLQLLGTHAMQFIAVRAPVFQRQHVAQEAIPLSELFRRYESKSIRSSQF